MFARGILGVVFGGLVAVAAFGLLQKPVPSVQLQFIDSQTGYGVRPSWILVEPDLGEPYQISTDYVDSAGRIKVNVPEGTARLSVGSEAYDSSATSIFVTDSKVVPIRFLLEPKEGAPEVDLAFVRGLTREDKHLVYGFVTDDESGLPIKDAVVSTSLGEVRTNARGFYSIYMPVSGDPAKVGLDVKADGLASQHYSNFETWPSGDIRVNISLTKKFESVDMASLRRRSETQLMDRSDCDSCGQVPNVPIASSRSTVGPALPKNIRVGRNCPTRTTCTSVDVVALDTYVGSVVGSEWYSCWGNVAGGMNALRAGTVSVRSYGISFVYSPATSTYDICDTTSCQVYAGTTTANGTQAALDTTAYVLTTTTGAVARSEYSAENNNAGCGDGFTGTGSTWPCIADPVCAGFSTNGHGRGLCQWGSARWATGKRLSSSQACTSAAPSSGQATKDWVQILSLYYPTYTLIQGGKATINSLIANPSSTAPGATTTLNYDVTMVNGVNGVMLGAAIYFNGTGTAITNSANDLKINLVNGNQVTSRPFLVPTTAALGTYSIVGNLWYDRNANNLIDSSDFVMADKTNATGLSLAQATIMTLPNASGRVGFPAVITANLKRSDTNAPLVGKIISFTVSGNALGSATTDSTGTATLNWTVTAGALGAYPLNASFSGDASNPATAASSNFYRSTNTGAQALNASGRAGAAVTLIARVLTEDGSFVPGKSVAFTVNGVSAGSATTDARGWARLSYTIPSGTATGIYPVVASFVEQLPYYSSLASGKLTVSRRTN